MFFSYKLRSLKSKSYKLSHYFYMVMFIKKRKKFRKKREKLELFKNSVRYFFIIIMTLWRPVVVVAVVEVVVMGWRHGRSVPF